MLGEYGFRAFSEAVKLAAPEVAGLSAQLTSPGGSGTVADRGVGGDAFAAYRKAVGDNPNAWRAIHATVIARQLERRGNAEVATQFRSLAEHHANAAFEDPNIRRTHTSLGVEHTQLAPVDALMAAFQSKKETSRGRGRATGAPEGRLSPERPA